MASSTLLAQSKLIFSLSRWTPVLPRLSVPRLRISPLRGQHCCSVIDHIPESNSLSDSTIRPNSRARLVLPDPFAPVSNNGRGRSDTAIRRRYEVQLATILSVPARGSNCSGVDLEHQSKIVPSLDSTHISRGAGAIFVFTFLGAVTADILMISPFLIVPFELT